MNETVYDPDVSLQCLQRRSLPRNWVQVFSSPWAIYRRVKVIKQSVKVIKRANLNQAISPRGALGKRPSITAYCSSCACATFSVSLISSNSNFVSS